MHPLIDFAVSAKQFTNHPCALLKLEGKMGDSAAASGLFLQIHDSQLAPVNTAVPKKSYPVSTSEQIFKQFQTGALQIYEGLYVCVSTTEATLTLASGNDQFSMISAELFEAEAPSGLTPVGDLTTNLNLKQIWAEAAGPKRLYKLQVLKNSGTASAKYIHLYAKDTPSPGDTPIAILGSLSGTTDAETFYFGKGGMEPFSIDSTGRRVGCTIAMSTQLAVYSAAGSTFSIRGEYK